MAKSPAVILFDSNGVAMAVEDGVAIPVGTQALLAAGSDGTDARFLLVDSSGRPVVVGAGVAGTPAGGVLSVQGVAGGTAIPVSGTFSNPSVSATNAAVPGSATQVGGTDGTNLQSAHVFDADTGGGTQYVLGSVLRKSASGGSVEAGTSSDPLRVDPTGTTTQPISAASLPLPTGAATEATLSTRLADATFTARINTLGQKAMANSTPVVLASDQTVIPVSDNSGSLTVDGTVTSNQGTAAALAGYWPVRVTDGTNTLPTGDAVGRAIFEKITDGTNTAAVKAASTAALATDPALVVAISPNNTITTSNASVGTNNAALPASSTEIGGSDGTNLQAIRVFDGDTGAGTQYVLGSILRKSASGGTVEAGTASDPLRVDPTGTTTQPVSAASLPLPTGAATSANQTTLGNQTTKINDGTNTSAVKAASTAAVATDPALVVAVSPNNTVTVAGTVTANIGTSGALALDATLTGGTQRSKITDGTNNAAVKAASTAAVATDPALVVAISPNNTITTSNASVGSNGSAIPTSSTEIGGSDGTNLQAVRVFDGDTGAGTQYVLGAILRKSASGGTVEAGTASDPLRVDPTGTTTQPISAASLPLPTGAATEATLATRLADATFTARINTLGQKTSANSTPVVLASDQSAIPVTDNAGSLTVDTTQLPAALVGGRLDANVGAWLGSTAPTVGSKTSANSVPVVIASDQGAVAISAASLPLPTGAATSANQTTLGSQTTKINDGTNTATVKAASTAAVAADQALVVAISPNTAPIIQVNGTHANAWNAVAVGAGGTSNVIDCQYVSHITVFGNSSGNTTLSYQVSQDNSNFYTTATFTTGTGNFGADFTTGARYVRLQSNTARTITATISGKA